MLNQRFDALIDRASKSVSNGCIGLTVVNLSDKHTRMAIVACQQMVKVLDMFIHDDNITDGPVAMILDCGESAIRKMPGAKPKFKHLNRIQYFFYKDSDTDDTIMYVNTDPYILPDLKYGIHIDNVCHRHEITMKEIADTDELIEAAENLGQTLTDIATSDRPFRHYENAVIEFFDQIKSIATRVGATAT